MTCSRKFGPRTIRNGEVLIPRRLLVFGTDNAGHADATWDITNDAAGRLVDLVGPTVSGNTAMSVVHTYDDRGRLAGVFGKSVSGIDALSFGKAQAW